MQRPKQIQTTARPLNLGTTGLGLFTLLALGLYLVSLAVLTWQDEQRRKLASIYIAPEPTGVLVGEPVTATLNQPHRY